MNGISAEVKQKLLASMFARYKIGFSTREELFFEFIEAMRFFEQDAILDAVDPAERAFAEKLFAEAVAFLAIDWEDAAASKKSVASFRTSFHEDFGMPFFLPIPPACQAISKSLREVLMIGSRETETRSFFLQSQISPFFSLAPRGYFLTGYNRNCFFYVKVDENNKVYIRCGLGGLYSADDDVMLSTFKKLADYDQVRTTAKREGAKLRYLDSMGWRQYRIQDKLGDYHYFPEKTAVASADSKIYSLLAGGDDPFKDS